MGVGTNDGSAGGDIACSASTGWTGIGGGTRPDGGDGGTDCGVGSGRGRSAVDCPGITWEYGDERACAVGIRFWDMGGAGGAPATDRAGDGGINSGRK
ncbi:MAG: hypothetical protein RBT16_05600 [Desulfococcus multivorans]|jgi:hypothetical protein|nr:hypothetical protein [Desulfococcus multivorans]